MVRKWTSAGETAYKLTVSDLHTYYVLAGAASVLVHNCGDSVVLGVGKNPAEELWEGAARVTDRPDSPREAGLPERLSDILAEDARWMASEADVQHIRDVWDELGIHCSPTVLRFVEEFNGSGFDYPRHPLDPGKHSCELNAERASRIVNGEKLRGYEQRTGEKLTPVGTAASGPLVLLVAEGGRTYGAYDAFLALYGGTPEEALVHLVDRVRPERLD